jgi:hypothetical protein
LLRQTPEAPDPGRVGRLEACAEVGTECRPGFFKKLFWCRLHGCELLGQG